MREDVNALGSSAQDVNVKKCTHFAPTLWSGKIYSEGNVLYHMWEKKYTSLVNRFNTVEARLKEVKAIIVDKQARHDEVEYFIEDLKKQDLLTAFDENV